DANGYRGFFLADVAYGNGRFVAVGTGAGKAVMTSTNGTNWQTIGTDMLRYCNSIAFGSDLFVGVGTGIITSTDGLTWNAQTIDRDSELRSVCYGDGIFVAVDYLGSVFTSTNGAYWSRVRDKDGSEMWSAGFGDGIFVAGGNGVLLEAGTDMSW